MAKKKDGQSLKRYEPNSYLGGGRPSVPARRSGKGVLQKVSEQFLADLHKDWDTHGRLVLEKVRTEDPWALVAVGGYGRGELHPHSDIDLMLLVTPEERERSREAIERFLLFLWDMGLEVGHSVRTLDECVEQAGSTLPSPPT